jgi:coenzyme F420-reducing hydrogenase beta subunit
MLKMHEFGDKNLGDLEAEVIFNGLCTGCGACAAFCHKYIEMVDGFPTAISRCITPCGLCYSICPRTFVSLKTLDQFTFGETRKDEDQALGYYNKIVMAKPKGKLDSVVEKAKAGVQTALLKAAMDLKLIDSAVLAKSVDPKDKWKAEPFIATNQKEIDKGAEGKLNASPQMTGLAEAIAMGKDKIALVGVPCQMIALRKVQSNKNYEVCQDKIAFALAEFCVRARHDGCASCLDMTAELSDISVDPSTTKEGWNTVIIRSEKGLSVFEKAIEKGYIETQEISDEVMQKLKTAAERKLTKNLQAILKDIDYIKLSYLLADSTELSTLLKLV